MPDPARLPGMRHRNAHRGVNPGKSIDTNSSREERDECHALDVIAHERSCRAHVCGDEDTCPACDRARPEPSEWALHDIATMLVRKATTGMELYTHSAETYLDVIADSFRAMADDSSLPDECPAVSRVVSAQIEAMQTWFEPDAAEGLTPDENAAMDDLDRKAWEFMERSANAVLDIAERLFFDSAVVHAGVDVQLSEYLNALADVFGGVSRVWWVRGAGRAAMAGHVDTWLVIADHLREERVREAVATAMPTLVRQPDLKLREMLDQTMQESLQRSRRHKPVRGK